MEVRLRALPFTEPSSPSLPMLRTMRPATQYVRRVAAEEFAASIARHFGASDSPFGHVDGDQVVSAFRAAVTAEAADAGQPMHLLPHHAMLRSLRRFLGPMSYEREVSEIMCATFGSTTGAIAAGTSAGEVLE